MSDFGEEIIERLNDNTALKDADNPMRKIILNTIGAFLDEYDNAEYFEQLFLSTAKGDYLDLHGITYKVYRKPDEDDDTYRNRIVYESLSHLTYNYLIDVYDLNLYTDVYELPSNSITQLTPAQLHCLTSDNPYLNSENGYFILIKNTDMGKYESLENKMVLGSRIKWAIV